VLFYVIIEHSPQSAYTAINMSKRSEKSQEAKKHILDAVTVLLEAHDFEVVTVRNICEKAGISTGTFYHYFADKTDLLTEFISMSFDAFGKTKSFSAANSDTNQAVIDTIVFFADYFESMGIDFVSSYFSPKNKSLDMDALWKMNNHRQLLDFILSQLQTLHTQGVMDPLQVHTEMSTIFFGSLFNWCVKRGEYDLHNTLKKMLTVHLNSYLKDEYKIPL
jgi:AcrR family transcriptional regulator